MPETLKRITPEEVLKAITENNLTPYQGEYTMDTESGKECACGLSAIIIAKGSKFSFINGLSDPEPFILGSMIEGGFQKDYLIGFVYGFDNRKTHYDTTNEDHALGIKDGIAAWEAVKHLAVVQ